ncbi:unnamed protein product [Eruca vesicaria subsp. sativa]|uniref:Uncharacterized protein n=1 Tax=Eruca vesicaria subsp. sativa TaxID=29727 RepID=A0ABC8LD86_ERUVS|nr:unnamed protein product [Eruca vesicaria subsp. sativa]
MFVLICVGKEDSEIDVFIKHDISEQSEPPIVKKSSNHSRSLKKMTKQTVKTKKKSSDHLKMKNLNDLRMK